MYLIGSCVIFFIAIWTTAVFRTQKLKKKMKFNKTSKWFEKK